MKNIIHFFLSICFSIGVVYAQDNFIGLRDELSSVIAPFRGTVGIAMIDLHNNDTLTIHNTVHFPMMSVYKLPQAIAVLHEVDKGTLSLHEKIRITKDILDKFTWSPLKEQHPGDTVELTIKELIVYTISYSDNLACDVLFERLGGTKSVHNFIQKEGFPLIVVKNTEREIGKNINLIYENSSTPFEMCRLLQQFSEKQLLHDSSTAFLLECMTTNYTSSDVVLFESDVKLDGEGLVIGSGEYPNGLLLKHKTTDSTVTNLTIIPKTGYSNIRKFFF